MIREKINGKTMKKVNTRNILNIIRRAHKISRRDLVVQTGLTKGTITNIVHDLLEKNYLIESGSGASLGGRKPIFLELNAKAGYVVGLELEASGITCVISDFKGKVLNSLYETIRIPDGKDKIIAQMTALTERCIADTKVARSKLLGLGLAVPGPCDYQNGIMLNPPNFPDWSNVPIKSLLSDKLRLPVYIGKETSCAVLSEFWFGENNANKRLFGITVGKVGIGGALVLDGNIFQEREGESMDIGHTVVQIDGYLCPCKSRGCLEIQADGNAARRYVLESSGREISFDELVRGTRDAQPDCVEAVKKCAFYISVAVGNTIALLSPQAVYFGGEFMEACPLLFEKTVAYLRRREYPAGLRSTDIKKFTFGKNSGAVGGLALVFDALSKA